MFCFSKGFPKIRYDTIIAKKDLAQFKVERRNSYLDAGALYGPSRLGAKRGAFFKRGTYKFTSQSANNKERAQLNHLNISAVTVSLHHFTRPRPFWMPVTGTHGTIDQLTAITNGITESYFFLHTNTNFRYSVGGKVHMNFHSWNPGKSHRVTPQV